MNGACQVSLLESLIKKICVSESTPEWNVTCLKFGEKLAQGRLKLRVGSSQLPNVSKHLGQVTCPIALRDGWKDRPGGLVVSRNCSLVLNCCCCLRCLTIRCHSLCWPICLNLLRNFCLACPSCGRARGPLPGHLLVNLGNSSFS